MEYSFLLEVRKAVATRTVAQNIQGMDESFDVANTNETKRQVTPTKRQTTAPSKKKKYVDYNHTYPFFLMWW